MKNLTEKLTFAVIFSVENQVSVHFKGRQTSKVKTLIEKLKYFPLFSLFKTI